MFLLPVVIGAPCLWLGRSLVSAAAAEVVVVDRVGTPRPRLEEGRRLPDPGPGVPGGPNDLAVRSQVGDVAPVEQDPI